MAVELTRRANGNLSINSFVLLWYLRISLNATVPGLYRRFGAT
jgi:hypothetical protein